MDRRRMFGHRNWFIKNAVFDCLLREQNQFGIGGVRVLAKGEEELDVNILYKLCNLFVLYSEFTVDRKDVMAVLHKIWFSINKNGKLDNALYAIDKEDYAMEAYEESIRIAESEGIE